MAALKAMKTTKRAGATAPTGMKNVTPEETTVQTTNEDQQAPPAPQATPPAPQATPPAPQATPPAPQATPPAPAPVKGKNALANVNANVLDNIEDLESGNYVTVDGTNFLYKASNEVADYIDMIVSYGKRFYQWVDESGPNKVFNNSDTKLDDRYKLKFEIRWFEESEEDSEPKEMTMTLATTSALQFISYIKQLATQGVAINQVVTRMTVSRQTSKDGKNRYSRVEFENVGPAE